MTYKLILGDCIEYMRTMPAGSVDAVITDPPYPGLKGGLDLFIPGTGVAKVRNNSVSIGTPWETSLDWMDEAWRIAKYGMLVFCSYHSVDIVKSKFGDNAIALITWHKRNSMPPINNVPHFTTEFIWAFKKEPGLKWRNLETMYDIPGLPGGCMGTERVKNQDGSTAHPTQKPVLLMRYLMDIGAESILDPFMGSGTTGVACMQLGRNFIGCEISTEYYKIAEKRIAQAAAQPQLFAQEKQPEETQEAMI